MHYIHKSKKIIIIIIKAEVITYLRDKVQKKHVRRLRKELILIF